MGAGGKIADALLTGSQRAILTDKLIGGTEVLLNSVMSWNESLNTEVTRHAVEDGSPITDNLFNNPAKYSMSAIIVDSFNIVVGPSLAKIKTVSERISQLKKWRDEKQVLYYIFDETIPNLVIESMNRVKNKNLGGINPFGIGSAQIDFNLTVINIAKAVQQEGLPNKGLTGQIEVTP